MSDKDSLSSRSWQLGSDTDDHDSLSSDTSSVTSDNGKQFIRGVSVK